MRHLGGGGDVFDGRAAWGADAVDAKRLFYLGKPLQHDRCGGAGSEICPRDLNTADEVRRAYIHWTYLEFSGRTAIPSSEALMATLKAELACGH